MIFPNSKLNDFFKINMAENELFSIFGDFGTGKTTFALQTSLSLARSNHQVLFFYTKPIFPHARVNIMIGSDREQKTLALLDNIIFIRIQNFEELWKLILKIESKILLDLNKSKPFSYAFIIDSITEIMRLDWNPESKKKNILAYYRLNQSLATLAYINHEYKIPILIVNETSKKQEQNVAIEIQSGRNLMEYWIKNSIHLVRLKDLNNRKIILINKNNKKEKTFIAEIKSKGFEIIDE